MSALPRDGDHEGDLRVLLVEDNDGDARLVSEYFRESSMGVALHRVASLEAASAHLAAATCDIVLLDLGLPGTHGVATLRRFRAFGGGLAVVVLTGFDDAETALEAVRAGAEDYVLKGRLNSDVLTRVVTYAMERHHRVVEREDRARRQSLLVELAESALTSSGLEGLWSDAATVVHNGLDVDRVYLLQCDRAGSWRFVAGLGWKEATPGEEVARVGDGTWPDKAAGRDEPLTFVSPEVSPPPAADALLARESAGSGLLTSVGSGDVQLVLGAFTDQQGRAFDRAERTFIEQVALFMASIAARAAAEVARQEVDAETRRLATAVAATANAVLITEPDGTISWVNDAFCRLSGFSLEEAVGATPRLVKSGIQDLSVYEELWSTITGGRSWRGRLVNRTKAGGTYVVDATVTPVLLDDGTITAYVGVQVDMTQAEEVQAALAARSRELALIMEQVPGTLWTTDRHLRYVRSIGSGLASLGLEQDELVGTFVTEQAGADEVILAAHLRALAHKEARYEFEAAGRSWRALTGPLYGRDGQVDGVVGLALDETDALEAAAELRASQARLQALFDNASDAFILADDGGRYLAANAAAAAMTGYSTDELVGMHPGDLAAPQERASTEMFEQFLAAGEDEGTFRILRADGRLIDAEYRAVSNIQPGVHLSVLRDVTDRNAMISTIAEDEQRFRQLADNTSDIVVRFRVDRDDDVEIDYVNPAVDRVLGRSAVQVVADPALLLPSAAIRELPGSRRDPGEVVGTISSTRFSVHRADGEPVWLEAVTSVVDLDPDSRTMQAVLRDVTGPQREREALEVALVSEQLALQELRRSSDFKNALLQNVAHELRTPLTSVMGFAEILAHHGHDADADERRLYAERILDASIRFKTLLDDFIDVDRLAMEAFDVAPACHRIDEVVAAALDRHDLGPRALHRHLTPCTMSVDAAAIGRIIDKLLDNIVRHTPPTTEAWVTLTPTRDGAVLVVEDDGPGLATGASDDPFAPFSQGPHAVSAAQPGTGVGLAIVRGLATSHGGGVTTEPRRGGGTRFVVTIADLAPSGGAPREAVAR